MAESLAKKKQHPHLATKSHNFSVRVRWADQIEKALPPSALLLLKHFREESRGQFAYSVPMVPQTINHAHKYFVRAGHVATTIHEKTLAFYDMHDKLLMFRRNEWNPSGVAAAVIVFESPEHWVTKARTIKEADCDNRVKVLLDAVKRTTHHDDCIFWEVHPYKLLGKTEATHVWLFDMGDLITGCAKEQ